MHRPVSTRNDVQNTPLSGWARLIYLFVAVNALAGAVILMFLPEQTGALFFWPVTPAINAGLFGALYLGGAAVVFWAAAHKLWEPSRFLVPILVTAGVGISAVTLLHLDSFAGGVRLVYWLVVYIGAPLLALLVYAHQERKGASWQVATPVRPLARWIATVTGAIVAIAGVFLTLSPQAAIPYWPWQTSPLMVRIFAAWFVAFGAGLLWFNVERDWRRLKQIPNLMIAASALDLLMVFLYRDQIARIDLTLWVYCAHLVMFGVAALAMHVIQYRASDNYEASRVTASALPNHSLK